MVCLYMVMITSINLSQEIFAIEMLRALKSPLEHRCKHVLGWLQLKYTQRETFSSRTCEEAICFIAMQVLLEKVSLGRTLYGDQAYGGKNPQKGMLMFATTSLRACKCRLDICSCERTLLSETRVAVFAS